MHRLVGTRIAARIERQPLHLIEAKVWLHAIHQTRGIGHQVFGQQLGQIGAAPGQASGQVNQATLGHKSKTILTLRLKACQFHCCRLLPVGL